MSRHVDALAHLNLGVMLESGLPLQSQSGRLLAPVPTIDTTTNRKTIRTIASVDQWLHREARREAHARRDAADFALTIFNGLAAQRLTDLDRAILNEYLGLQVRDQRTVDPHAAIDVQLQRRVS